MDKRVAFIIAGVFLLSVPVFALSQGGFVAQLGGALSQFAAAALGIPAASNNTATMSAVALAANHLYELEEGDYAVVTQEKGPPTGIKKKFVASLPGGELYKADVDKNTTIQIIPYKAGAHIAVPAADQHVEIHNQFDELVGYDASGIAKSVSARVEKSGSADVIVIMKLLSKQYFNASDNESTRANKKAQFNSAKNSIAGAMGAGGKIKHELPIINGLAITVNAHALKGLANNPNVQRVSPDLMYSINLDQSVDYINAPSAWNQTDANGNAITGQGTKIAVIDTGVDYTLADLGGCFGAGCKVEGGYDFVNNDTNPMDDHGHGTHVAATAAGVGMVGTIRLNGVAPGSHVLAYKVCNTWGSCDSSNIIAAISRATDPNNDGSTADHADVISMSLGRYCGSYTSDCGPADDVSTAVNNATAVGVVSAIAAGNGGTGTNRVGSPATAATAVTVAAGCAPHGDLSTSRCPNGNNTPIASFSSRGPVVYEGTDYRKPDITAPGVMICAARWSTAFSTTCFDSQHVRISGTSMATPHIAGVLALMKQAYPGETPAQLKTRIKAAAADLGGGMTYNDQGAGMVNVQRTIIDVSKVTSTPSSWTFSTNPAGRLSRASEAFSIRSRDPGVTTLIVGLTSPDPGITFTTGSSTLNVAGGVSASFTGTIQVNNDVVRPGLYTGTITLKDPAGNLQGSIPTSITVLPTIAITPTGTLDYGFDNPGLTTWSSALIPVTIKNLRTDIAQTVTATPSSFVSGITYRVSPLSVTIPAAGSAIVNTGFTVTNNSVPNGHYNGSVTFASAASAASAVTLPTKFTKFHVLTIQDTVDSSSNPLDYIELYDRTTFYTRFYYVGGKSIVLYFDNPTSFDAKIRFGYQSGFYDRLVLKEGVQVNGVTTLSVNGSQATRRVQLTGTDINGKSTTYPIRLSLGSNFYYTEYGIRYVSDVSANYTVQIDANPYEVYSSVTSPFYIYGGSVQGIASDVTITNRVADLKKTVFPVAVNRPAGSTISTGIYMCLGSLDICYGFESGYATSTPYEHIVYSSSPFTYFYLVADENRGGCQSGGEGGTLSHGTVACANTFQSQVVNPVSGEHFVGRLSESSLPGVVPSRINLGLGPTGWFLKITKVGNTRIDFDQPFAAPKSPLLRQDYATQENSSIPYTLYRDGTEVESGMFPPWGVYYYSSPGPFHYGYVPSAGRYNFQSTFSYQVQGLSFSGDVDSTFDTSRADPNPPFLKQFEYSTNGVRTDTYYSKASKSSLLLGIDPNSGLMQSVAVSYSIDGATFTQVSVVATTTAASAGYVATIPPLTTTQAAITLRFLATDASLNTLQYTFRMPISNATPPNQPSSPVIGFVDGVVKSGTNYIVGGWACQKTNPASINVQLYVGGPAGTGTFIGDYLANKPSEVGVATACQTTGTAYRYIIPLATSTMQTYAGQSIYVRGISPSGGGNPTLTQSGTFKVPALPPTNLTKTCSTDGRSVTLGWSAVPSATAYPLRLDYRENNAPSCIDGWNCAVPPDFYSNTVASTSYTATITPGKQYSWWVHALVGGVWSAAASGSSFTCTSSSAPTATLTASSTAIVSGQSSTLSWSSTNATSCTPSGFTGSGTLGTATVRPTQTSAYSIGCIGSGGSASASTSVSVSPAPKFVVNDRIRATTAVKVRSTYSATASLLGTVATSSLGTVIGGPQNGGGSTWWNVRWDNSLVGWSVQAYLVKVSAALSASPNPCTVAVGTTTCATTLTRTAPAGVVTQLWFTKDTDTPKPVACKSGSATTNIPWIVQGHTYHFNLYATAACTTSITGLTPSASVTVTGQSTTTARAPSQVATVLSGLKQTFVALFSATFGGE